MIFKNQVRVSCWSWVRSYKWEVKFQNLGAVTSLLHCFLVVADIFAKNRIFPLWLAVFLMDKNQKDGRS